MKATIATAKEQDWDFEKFWHLYPKRPGANKTQASREWAKRIKEDENPEDMLLGCKRYRMYCEMMKIEPQYIKQASTFIGPDKHYQSDWTPTGNTNQQWLAKLRGVQGGDDESTIDAE